MLAGVGIVLLTLVGYTSGAVLAAPRRQPVPFLVDLPVVAALWTAGFLLRPVLSSHGKSVAGAFLLAFAVSACITLVRRSLLPPARLPDDAPRRDTFLRRIAVAWGTFARRMGNYQGRLILAFFYFSVVLPFGVLVRAFSDPLALRRPPSWHPRRPREPDIPQARMQF